MKIYIFLFPFFFPFLLSCMEKQIIPKTEQSRLSLRTLMQDTECKGLIERIYFDAFNFGRIDNFSLQHEENKTLINMITNMHTLEGKGITADHLSIHAYDQCNWKTDPHLKQRLPLFFGCLKNYQQGALQKKEILPRDHYYDISVLPESAFQKAYPNYYTLAYSIVALFKASNLKDLLIFLYSKKRMSFHHHYPESTEIDLKNTFYPEVNFLLDIEIAVLDNNLDRLYNLLQLTEKAKDCYINEKKLGLAIADLELNAADTLRNEDVSYQKNRAMLFCSLVQKYNEAKGIKKTPTPAHYSHYFFINVFNIALPDSFDATLVDKNSVAFDEFKDLITDIIELKHQSKEAIQRKVHFLYFQGK
ncbi:MAG TPA: hypothetical protein VKU36_04580 [Candidatus Babeliales bacterium]|nr:hypothetical protein [Candidatus Babeliales bacterium]